MVDKVKIEPKIITIHKGRIAFLRTEPSYRTNKTGQEVKVDPKSGKTKKPQWRMTWLLDPTDRQAAETIVEIKAEAKRQLDLFFGVGTWPKDNETTGTKGVIPCFGDANKLPKVYDGYANMFFVKVSDTTEPVWGSRRGQSLRFDSSDGAWHILDKATGRQTEETIDPADAPYSGAYGRGRISLYVYNNESAGVNANFRSVQFLEPGEAFGGGGRRSASDEMAEMAGDASGKTAASGGDEPW